MSAAAIGSFGNEKRSGSETMNTMSYKGYDARIEYSDEDELFIGRIAGIRDGVSFHAETVSGLKAAFHEAVDDYIETCAKIGKEPQTHTKEI
jgi:predicted HicB family RNase H-like nuclease